MAKRHKRKPPMSTDVLEAHREWLIRCVLIGQGYVVNAIEAAKEAQDATAYKVHKRHYDEMQKVIDGVRPAAEDVLRILGERIAKLTETPKEAHA